MNLIVWENQHNQRFDRFLRKYFKSSNEIKLSDIYSLIRKWKIKINWKKQKEDYRIKLEDKITFDESIDNFSKDISLKDSTIKTSKKDNLKIEDIKKQIIFENENWIVWNKYAWVVVHGWNKHTRDITMNDLLEYYVKKTDPQNISDTFKPSFWFRLDKDTSGIIIAAKNYDSLQYLNQIIRDRKVDKTYLTIVSWIFPQEKIIDYPIFKWYDSEFGRSKSFVNKEKWLISKTKWSCLRVIEDKVLWKISLVKVKLYTGRMHQIRVHLSHIWYPVLWDIVYWNSALNRLLYKEYKINRQLLHSYNYGFYDKFENKKVDFEVSIPSDFEKLWFII